MTKQKGTELWTVLVLVIAAGLVVWLMKTHFFYKGAEEKPAPTVQTIVEPQK